MPSSHLLFPHFQSQTELACEDAKEAIRLCPTFGKAYYRAALAQLRLKHAAEALETARTGLHVLDAAAPERADIAGLLADARVAVVCSEAPDAARDNTTLDTLGTAFHGLEDADTQLSDVAVLVRDEAAADSPLALFAAFVAAAQASKSDAQDAVLARTARHVAALGPRTAHVFGRTPGALGALAALVRRSTALPTLADAVRALALCTAASPDNKDLLARADLLGAVQHLFALPDSAQLLHMLITPESEHDCAVAFVEALRDLLAGNAAMQRVFGERYGLAETLLARIDDAAETPALQGVCAEALGALCELDDNAGALARTGGVVRLAHVLTRDGTASSVAAAIVAALAAAARASPAAAAAVAAPETPAVLLDRAMALGPPDTPAFQQAAVDLLTALVRVPDSVVPTAAFLVRVPSLISAAQKEEEEEQEQEKDKSGTSTVVRRNVAAVIGMVAEARGDAAAPLAPFAGAMLGWVAQETDADLRATALWLLGNVARSEGVVEDLVAHRGVVALLCRVLDTETQRADVATAPRVVGAALGLLRNLAVVRGTRDALADGGVLAAVVAALPRAGCRDQHVTLAGVVLLSALVRGSPRRARLLAAVPRALAVATQIARGVAFAPPGADPAAPAPVVVVLGPHGEKDLRVQYEAARLLAALCTAEPACARALAAAGVAQDLHLLLNAPYDVLRQEGREALNALEALGLSTEETAGNGSSGASASTTEGTTQEKNEQ